jgi:hypothetical protein
VVAGDPEHGGDLGHFKPVPELVDDVTLAVVEAPDRGAHQRAHLLALGLSRDVRAVVRLLGDVIKRRGLPGPEPVHALVARTGEPPGAQPLRITQPRQL